MLSLQKDVLFRVRFQESLQRSKGAWVCQKVKKGRHSPLYDIGRNVSQCEMAKSLFGLRNIFRNHYHCIHKLIQMSSNSTIPKKS